MIVNMHSRFKLTLYIYLNAVDELNRVVPYIIFINAPINLCLSFCTAYLRYSNLAELIYSFYFTVITCFRKIASTEYQQSKLSWLTRLLILHENYNEQMRITVRNAVRFIR